MSIAIISYDVKFVEDFTKGLENVKYEVFGDSLAFIKNFNNNYDAVVYDASSGVFAEDDLKYLINKMKNENLKYYVLISPVNPINTKSFDNNVEFFDKEHGLENVKEKIFEKVLNKTEEKKESLEEIFSFEENKSNEENIQNMETNKLEEKFEDIFETFEIQETPSPLEKNEEELKIDMDSLLTEFESVNYPEKIETVGSETEEISSSLISTNFLEDFDKGLEELEISSEIVEPENKFVERLSLREIMEENEKLEEKELKEEGGKNMVANFNVQVSSDDIKNVVLDIARNYLKNDPAINTIIDHLQIDFQSETMRELEEIKKQLKEKVREEAEKILKEEITSLIKNELKEYVAEITAKIVKERLEQAFKSF